MRSLVALVLLWGASVAQPTNPDDLDWEELPEPEDVEPEAPSAEPVPPTPATAETDPPASDEPSTSDDPTAVAEPTQADPTAVAEPTQAESADSAPPPNDPPPSLQPPAPEPGASPNWQRGGDSYYGGTLVGPILGGGVRAVAFGVGATHFIVPHVGIGADLVNVIRWGNQGTYYEFEFTPIVTLLALPRRRFTPLIWGGFGLDVFNRQLGTYGRWVGGGGFAFKVGRRAIVTVGAEVDGRVPLSRWNANFTCGITRSNCSLGIQPVIGFAIPL